VLLRLHDVAMFNMTAQPVILDDHKTHSQAALRHTRRQPALGTLACNRQSTNQPELRSKCVICK
jgi:hypothetical protein